MLPLEMGVLLFIFSLLMIFSSANIKRFSHKFAPSRGGGKIKEDGRYFPHFLKLVYDG